MSEASLRLRFGSRLEWRRLYPDGSCDRSHPMLDDGRAVEQARRGDEAAWRVLFERHADLVFRLAMREIGDRDAALDVLQETFLRAWRGLERFRGDASFRSWVARIAINESRTWLRGRSRRREVRLDDRPLRAPGTGELGAAVERSELAERALALVRALPDQQRAVILLRTTEGYSYREIAEILGTSEGSCRVSYHHGMAKLREHLVGPGRGEEEAAGAG